MKERFKGIMKNNFKKSRLLYGLYIVIYLPWFFILEACINETSPDIHILNRRMDELIPFCEYFIIPYVFWVFYILGACVFMLFKATDKEFQQFGMTLIIGMSLCLFICMIYPNGVQLRPEIENLPDNIFGVMVKYLYLSDTSTNVFPSIHVFNSLAVHISLTKCEALKNHTGAKCFSLITCILICMSTVFLKQHCIVDVIGACGLMIVMYVLIYAVNYKKVADNAKETVSIH